MNRAMLAIRSAVAFAALATAPCAFAHAFLDHADPRVGSTVDHAPSQVTLRFTEALEPAFSKVKVLDANGHEVDAKDGAVDANDRTVMHATVRNLPPGKYRVEWRAVSADTHVTSGNFTFEVRR